MLLWPWVWYDHLIIDNEEVPFKRRKVDVSMVVVAVEDVGMMMPVPSRGMKEGVEEGKAKDGVEAEGGVVMVELIQLEVSQLVKMELFGTYTLRTHVPLLSTRTSNCLDGSFHVHVSSMEIH